MAALRTGSMCGALSRRASRWRATSSRASRSVGKRAFASSTVKSLSKAGSMPGIQGLAADGQAVREHVGEARGPDLILRLLYVVFDETVEHALSVGDQVRGESVPVTRLAHRARVHQIRPANPEIEGVPPEHRAVRRRCHGLDVRVPEIADADVRIIALQDGEVLLRGDPVDDVLVRVA